MGLVTRALDTVLHTPVLARAPIPMFKVGLGPLFAGRFLLLEHIGRRSGEPRYVVLEVIDRPSKGSYRVVSGFGRSSQWFRNIEANPEVRVTAGTKRNRPAKAVVLPSSESTEVLRRYAEQHPAAWDSLSSILEQHVTPGTEGYTSIPVVDFTLISQ